MEIKDFLLKSKICDLRVIRGLGIIPARFEIELQNCFGTYILEAEQNFRIIYRNKLVTCFDDMFLNDKYEEISLRKFREQRDLEYTLLFKTLKSAKKRCIDKTINSAKCTKYGDVILTLTNSCKIQIINDSHLYNSTVLRVVTKDKTEVYKSNNEKKFLIQSTLFEIKNGRLGTVMIENNFNK